MSGIVVLGDILLDRDIDGVADRLCPDAPVPVLTERDRTERPGGAALAAVMLALDGVEVTLVGALGADPAGDRVRALLADLGVSLVELPYVGATPEKIRMRAGPHQLMRLDRGTAPGRFGEVPTGLRRLLDESAGVLVSDYGRGVAALVPLRRWVAGTTAERPVVWDPHTRGATPVPGARLVTPNRGEAAAFAAAHGAGLDGTDPDGSSGGLVAEAALLRRAWRVQAVAVTTGADGALLVEQDCPPQPVPTEPASGHYACGAGDRFAATATVRLAEGGDARSSVAEAVRAASMYVAGDGPASLFAHLSLEGTT
jgi:D-beta-D-heptose 7-phosphate kinase/D-beta-D-heptose 1-phosphate adenosyltransferase